VRFVPVGVQTRVTVEYFGWDGISQQHAARHGFPLGVFQLRRRRVVAGLLCDLADVATAVSS